MRRDLYSFGTTIDLINRKYTEGEPFVFALDYEMQNGIFVCNPNQESDVLFRVHNITNSNDSKRREAVSAASLYKRALLDITEKLSLEEYSVKFQKVADALKIGDSYLVNLTCKTKVNSPLSLEQIFYCTGSPFGLYVAGLFVSFSPERFVKIEKGEISCTPMKGTIDASVPDALQTILNNYKESCEHNTITDLIRNDLGIVCDNVWVERFRYAGTIKTDRGKILQISSDIRGKISESYLFKPGDLLAALLPAGSISGAPKPSTINIIREAEGEPRGFYTGIFGYFDGKTLDTAVLIRFIQKDGDGSLWYRSGGGVTVNSTCAEEYNEMVNKIYLPLIEMP